jgi:hypothetical protein
MHRFYQTPAQPLFGLMHWRIKLSAFGFPETQLRAEIYRLANMKRAIALAAAFRRRLRTLRYTAPWNGDSVM